MADSYARVRRDVGADEDSLPDEQIDEVWAEAGELYSSETAIAAYARVLLLRGMVILAAKEVDNSVAETEEKASQYYDHLQEQLEYWEGKVAAAPKIDTEDADLVPVFFARAKGRRGL